METGSGWEWAESESHMGSSDRGDGKMVGEEDCPPWTLHVQIEIGEASPGAPSLRLSQPVAAAGAGKQAASSESEVVAAAAAGPID